MRMHQNEIFYIFGPNLEEIHLSGKNMYFSKTKANLASPSGITNDGYQSIDNLRPRGGLLSGKLGGRVRPVSQNPPPSTIM